MTDVSKPPVADEAQAAIRIRGARKVYGGAGGREAVRDVSITVAAGTVHGLLGPNGAGKTTTLKMLLGLVGPSGGEFHILGRPASDPASRRPLGFLPEQPYFSPQLTAREALRLYGRLLGMDKASIAEQTITLLERVGLEGREDTTLSKFSRGMLQRLGIAQALLGEPEVVVLDEPASGLDPVGQRDVRSLMRELRADGVTVLLSSHQLSEVEAVCDRVSILNRGRVAAEGPIDELLAVAGRSAFEVAGFGEALPAPVARFAEDVEVGLDAVSFSARSADVRDVVEAVYGAGGTVVSVSPLRHSLEDYFASLLEEGAESDTADEEPADNDRGVA